MAHLQPQSVPTYTQGTEVAYLDEDLLIKIGIVAEGQVGTQLAVVRTLNGGRNVVQTIDAASVFASTRPSTVKE